jgi:serine/threonine protein kinase
MPLDVCAFVGKEISSALDHAHRKRDHTGKSLGIVHRDVSPQNVLVSYSGEVKLVDFGIAKATMKARQTAVGVIKGKYYYMSPEQARGDLIDHRSDIFSSGIVLYEMITGQMLYLEEDLHKLLEMARAADIAPPSKLRKGVPPQLERIVMHALAKAPEDRYQSAGDFATDLERFLHAYSPVFTASKLSALLRQVVGDPLQVPDVQAPFESIEFRDGVMSTHPLDDSEVAHAIDRDELRDENSVIFRMADLDARRTDGDGRAAAVAAGKPPARPQAPALPQIKPPRAATPPPLPGALGASNGAPGGPASALGSAPSARQASNKPTTPSKPIKPVAPKVTRATDTMPPVKPPAPTGASKIPSVTGSGGRSTGSTKIPQIAKPRQPHEETRQLEQAAPANPLHDDSGLLLPDGNKWTPGSETADDELDLDNIGERTMVTAAPGSGSDAAIGMAGLGGFMLDAGDDDAGPVEATLVTSVPGFGGAPAIDHVDADDIEDPSEEDDVDDDMPTLSGGELRPIVDRPRAADPAPAARPAVRGKAKAPPPAALAAKIHAPAVSELRKPRPSRRTPPGGIATPPPNVLQAIVSSQSSEPMPAPRQSAAALPPPPATFASAQPTAMLQTNGQPHGAQPTGADQPIDPYATPFPVGTPGSPIPAYATDASGLPLAIPTPPGMQLPQGGHAPGVPSHLQPYLHMQGMPPGGYDHTHIQQQIQQQPSSHGYPQLSPQALYQFQPSQQQQQMSITGQMRLFEVDEMPSQYKIGSAGRRWFTYVVSGLLAVSVAAGVTFVIIRSTRETAPVEGTLKIESSPDGGTVVVDGNQLSDKTPVTIDHVPVGTHHVVRITLPHRKPYEEAIDIPKKGGELTVAGRLDIITGKLLVNSIPPGAELWINGQIRAHTPTTVGDLDTQSKIHVELRLKDYQPFVHDYDWPADGTIQIQQKLEK